MSTPRISRRILAGWLALAGLLAYAFLIHHGVGPAPEGPHRHWWQPRGFLIEALQASSAYVLIEPAWRGIVVFTLPAAALLAAVFAATRSAVARTVGLAAVLATALFAFYGLRPSGAFAWRFFGWRGSGSMLLISLVVAAAASAPFLAASWLRQSPTVRALVYAPIFLGALVLLREVTGTDPDLAFAISPWPVVPVFGLQVGVPVLAGVLACLGLVFAAWSLRERSRPLTLAGVGAALAIPPMWLRFGPAGGRAVLIGALAVALVAALAALAARRSAIPGPPDEGGPASVALRICLGVLLVALPVFAGEALAQRDWDVTRGERAQRIIDALARYYEREQMYPDALEDLVRAKDLAAVPDPRIGFGLLGEERFTYQNFGTSYILEFSAPGWVQCAYNPPYPDEDDADAANGPAGAPGAQRDLAPGEVPDDEAATPGAWSCPSKPPELW